MCTTGVGHFTRVSFATFATGLHCSALRRSVIGVFHYCSIGGDTAVSSGLHARLCHAFLVIIIQPESR